MKRIPIVWPLCILTVLIICVIPVEGIAAHGGISGLRQLSLDTVSYSPEDSTERVVDEAMKRGKAPVMRFGFGVMEMINIMDEDLNYYYNKAWALMVDWFFLRKRSRRGNGFDLYTRFTYRNYSVGMDILAMESDLRYEKNAVHMLSLDVGIRGVLGAYFLYQLWQIYIVAAPRALYYLAVMTDSRFGDGDKQVNLASVGFVGGAGIEVTLVSMIGIFAEYNIGYTPVGRTYRNLEGHHVYVGITWRDF